MAHRTRLKARQSPLTIAAPCATGIWLGTWGWAASMQLNLAAAVLRKLGLPPLVWCMLGSPLMAPPVARVLPKTS